MWLYGLKERIGEMPVISFQKLHNITLEIAETSITRYSGQNGPWLHQFDNFYRNIRLDAAPDKRMSELLTIVRGSGWNMNRQRQCASIIEDIRSGRITNDKLNNFWNLVDALPNINLRALPCTGNDILRRLEDSFGHIREILRDWHQSAGSVCFLTKVILMFNWGQTPAFDSRIRAILDVGTDISNEELVQSLVEIGTWIRYFEARNGIHLDELATDVMLRICEHDLQPLPLGRSLDMLLFSLPLN